jgi:hypothetical protein
VSEDPARTGTTWFAYAGGDPIGKVDPDGRAIIDIIEFLWNLGESWIHAGVRMLTSSIRSFSNMWFFMSRSVGEREDALQGMGLKSLLLALENMVAGLVGLAAGLTVIVAGVTLMVLATLLSLIDPGGGVRWGPQN